MVCFVVIHPSKSLSFSEMNKFLGRLETADTLLFYYLCINNINFHLYFITLLSEWPFYQPLIFHKYVVLSQNIHCVYTDVIKFHVFSLKMLLKNRKKKSKSSICVNFNELTGTECIFMNFSLETWNIQLKAFKFCFCVSMFYPRVLS